ncbi:Vitamin B12 import ATP-binding protein BtuD [Streptomyces californicus]
MLAALRDAGAHDFVAALPDGMLTVLGEDGAGLSAGQRQRLALARAFLADRPVLLLDEPTASLDGESEAGIVDAARRRLSAGRTVLLVVHRPALLAVADRVVTLEAGGTTAAGAGATVQTTGPAVPQPLAGGELLDARRAEELRAADSGPGEPEASPGRALARVRASAGAQRGQLTLALLLGSLAVGSAVGLMAVSGWLISRASEEPPVMYLMMAVTATRAFGIGRAVFRYAERLVSHDAVLKLLADLRVSVYRGLERIAPAGLRTTRRGDLLTRLVADVDALQDYWLRWLLPAGTAVVVGTAAAGFTGWLLPEAGVILAVGLLLAGVGVPLVGGACARRTERQLAPARADLATRVADLLGGTAELGVAGALPERRRRLGAADALLTRIASRTAAATALGGGLSALVCGLTVVAAGLVAVPAVNDGRLSGVALAVVVLTPLAAFEAVAGLPLALQYRRRVARSAERVYEVLDAPVPVREPEHPAEEPAAPFPLEVRGLSARYPGAGRDALTALDLTLTPGRRIAVVGPSGSGKTTLAQVLLRFLDASSGTYRLGDVPASALESDTVRRSVGLCAQDAHVFDSTIRENLRLAAEAQRDRERLAVYEDRDRIARDLHDLVIQRLFATGMMLESAQRRAVVPEVRTGVGRAVDELDVTIQEIRTAIFALQQEPAEAPSRLRTRVLREINMAAVPLGFKPSHRFLGPVDSLVGELTGKNLVAALREALSNAFRHAGASLIDVVVDATVTLPDGSGAVRLSVADDGVGIPEGGRRSGLRNLARRAESLGGSSPDRAGPRGGRRRDDGGVGGAAVTERAARGRASAHPMGLCVRGHGQPQGVFGAAGLRRGEGCAERFQRCSARAARIRSMTTATPSSSLVVVRPVAAATAAGWALPMAKEAPAQLSISTSLGMSPKATTSAAAIPRSAQQASRVVALETPSPLTSRSAEGLERVKAARSPAAVRARARKASGASSEWWASSLSTGAPEPGASSCSSFSAIATAAPGSRWNGG